MKNEPFDITALKLQLLEIRNNLNATEPVTTIIYTIFDKPLELANLNTIRKKLGLTPLNMADVQDPIGAVGLSLSESQVVASKLLNNINKQIKLNDGVQLTGFLEFKLAIDGKLGLYYTYIPPKTNVKQLEVQEGDIVLDRFSGGIMMERVGEGMLGIFDTIQDAIRYAAETIVSQTVVVIYLKEGSDYIPLADLVN